MALTNQKELKVREKKEVSGTAEPTKPGLVFTPNVDIFESETEITLMADIPGVRPEGLTIDLRDNTLTLVAETPAAEKPEEEIIYSEYATGKYYRQFSLSEVIDQEKIDARLNNGVLQLVLKKVARATPRQITVTAE